MPKKPPHQIPETGPYTVKDVAALLACSEQHVRVQAREGRIPGAFRVSSRMIRLDRAIVDAWLESRKQATAAN